MWASSPHLRSKQNLQVCFSCCNCIFLSFQIQTKLYHENQGCKFEQGNGAIAACWQVKAGVEPPFVGCCRPFSLRALFLVKAISLHLFQWSRCKFFVCCSDFTRRGGLVRPASKSCRFSHHPLRVPKAWHGDFAACGQRSGLLALNLANIFEKLLDQKTF